MPPKSRQEANATKTAFFYNQLNNMFPKIWVELFKKYFNCCGIGFPNESKRNLHFSKIAGWSAPLNTAIGISFTTFTQRNNPVIILEYCQSFSLTPFPPHCYMKINKIEEKYGKKSNVKVTFHVHGMLCLWTISNNPESMLRLSKNGAAILCAKTENWE